MSLNIDSSTPADKYSQIRARADRVICTLDTCLTPDNSSSKYLAAHLEDCLKLPTVGLMAYNDAYVTRGPNNPEYFKRNLQTLKTFPNIKPLIEAFDAKLKQLYPKTRQARDFIIETNRISFEYKEPVKHNFRRLLFKMIGQ